MLLLQALPLLLLAACQPSVPATDGPLAPGEMRVISVEAVGPDPDAALLPNGAFEEWYGGLPAPTGFEAPAGSEFSSIHRDIKSGHLNMSGYTVRQTWQAVETALEPTRAFRTSVTLAPDTEYAFEVVAEASPGFSAAVGAYEIDAQFGVRVLAREVVVVSDGAPARYRGTFRTVAGGAVVLASHGRVGSALPGRVTWSAWTLARADDTEAAPVTMAEAPARHVAMNNVVDQVRSQFALYGGREAWANALYPVEKNLSRILRETEAQPGESVLGYEGYAFKKSEHAHYVDGRDLTRNGDGADRPAWDQLLKAERQLHAHNIHLIVLPVPDRIHLYVDFMYQAAAEGPLPLLPHTLLVDRLLQQDVFTLDVGPVLWRDRHEGKAVYWRGDDGIPSATLQMLAAVSAPAIRAMLPEGTTSPGAAYEVVVDTIPLEQRLVDGLPPAQRGLVGGERCDIYSVKKAGGALFALPEKSVVLAVGSYAVAHQIRGASFAAHLSRELGVDVAVPEKNISDAAVPGWLEESIDRLEDVQVVVFCFPESALASPD